jgi:hypothetical protein
MSGVKELGIGAFLGLLITYGLGKLGKILGSRFYGDKEEGKLIGFLTGIGIGGIGGSYLTYLRASAFLVESLVISRSNGYVLGSVGATYILGAEDTFK